MEVTGLLLFFVLVVSTLGENQLKWSSSYYLKAVLTVPGANLTEPYQVWVDGDSKNSRVDFYNGMDKLYKTWDDLAEKYVYYKIMPETKDDISIKDVCHTVDLLSPEIKSYTQNTYLPEKDFKFVNDENFGGFDAQKFVHVIDMRKFNTTATSTIWVRMKKTVDGDKLAIPLRYVYEMKIGNNTLDYFCHDYLYYLPLTPSSDVVQKPADLDCSTPLLGSLFQAVDPLLEYVEPEIGHYRATNAFHRFKEIHNKTYEEDEHITRLQIFKNNLRFIESENRQHKSYRLGVTYFADLSEDEMRSIIMSSYHDVGDSDQTISDDDDIDSDGQPYEEIDWRQVGAVTPVKDQTTLCGGCYAFVTAATIEAALYISRGFQNLEEISEQAIIDCTWGGARGNLGCAGGTYEYALYWIKQHGIPTKNEYGPYLALEGKCHVLNMTNLVHLSAFSQLPRKHNLIKIALKRHGPLIASVDASPRSYTLYVGGIYDDPACRSEPSKRTHAVNIIGYGKEQNQSYWILKNTFGTGWGEDGFMRITTKDNRCGLKNYVYAVEVEKSS